MPTAYDEADLQKVVIVPPEPLMRAQVYEWLHDYAQRQHPL